jgi:hypothetical protein
MVPAEVGGLLLLVVRAPLTPCSPAGLMWAGCPR